MCWWSFWICGKGLLLQKKKLLSTFSIHCSASSDASSLLWNLLISSWAKSRTLNTTWQDWVWHFWDSQAISHRFWVKTAAAPLVLQMACELYTYTVQWCTQMSGLSKVWSGCCESLLAKPNKEKTSLPICTASTVHCHSCIALGGQWILIRIYCIKATKCWCCSINPGHTWYPRSQQNTKLHRVTKGLGLIHTFSFLARVHFPCFSEMAYYPAPRATFSALSLPFVCLPLDRCLSQLSSRRQMKREQGAPFEFGIGTHTKYRPPLDALCWHTLLSKRTSHIYIVEPFDPGKANFGFN